MSTCGPLDHLTLHISSEVLDNAFKVDFVSEGCFGAVYRVPYDGVLCAAKDRCFDNTYRVEHFQQECLLHSKLHHPNIVRMLGVCYHGSNPSGQPIKIMELLESHLSSVVRSIISFPMYVELTLMQDISRGLDYLHARNPPIVHSYLTTETILLTANLVAKIGGFTFAAEMVSKRPVQSDGNKILRSSLYCGPPFDIYSFGCIICEIITKQYFRRLHKCLSVSPIGKPLTIHIFNIGQHEYLMNQITDASLKQLVMDCVNDNPDLRPSASLISEMIGNLIKGECRIMLLGRALPYGINSEICLLACLKPANH